MKKILIFSAAVLGLIAVASCAKQEQETVDSAAKSKVRTTINAILESPKTALGDKTEGSWPNYWKEGDKISVNGLTSIELDGQYDGKDAASFTVEGVLSTPYYAAYPASAVSEYSTGSATITVPAVQYYSANTYDPAAYIMGGKSESASISLTPQVSVLHLSLTDNANICKIKVTGNPGAALSGSFSTNFVDAMVPVTVSNVVELKVDDVLGVDHAAALDKDFFICLPAGISGALTIEIFDHAGGKMTKNATLKNALEAGKVYSPAAFAYVPSYSANITAEGITSSTAIICWDNCPKAAYTIGVYSDAGCTALVDSYAVSADNGCWNKIASPRFCISGLTQNTTYYVKVTNGTADSNILPVTTAAFGIVIPDDNPADVDDVILAEDFGELRWDSELINGGVGYFPTSQDQFSNSVVDQFLPIDTNSEKTLGSQTSALLLSRLAHWAQGANNNLYIHPGYIKLVGNKKVTHLVTPALNNIPEGKLATLEVEITACPYFSESSASYATFDAIVAVQPAGSYKVLSDDPGTSKNDNTNTLDLSTNIQPITLDAETAWKTYKVTLTGVGKGARLAFGAHKDVTQNSARMNISDMKVTIKALEEPGITASVKAVSSSTAAFTWTYGGEASVDIAKPYTIALYSDENCENLVVSFDIPADDACWNGKTPCFVFGGLNPDTEYWFVATDTDASVSSDPVSATTEAFTVVDATTVTEAAVGDVILAEDFSEASWSGDELNGAAGFVPNPKSLTTIPSGANPTGEFVKYDNTGSRFFGSGVDLGDSRMSHGWGFFGNSSVYLHNGYSRVGASGGRTHIVTPALSGIPAGKLATIEVTVTATKYGDPIQIAVFAEKGLTMDSQTATDNAAYKKYYGASLSDGYAFDITTTKVWDTKSVTITNVDSDCQLLIGSLENYTNPSDNKKKNRFYISDVKVQITALTEDPVMKIKDEASFLAFVAAVDGDKSVEAEVTQDITLSSATAEAFASIEDYAGTLDGKGHTITGLTKPMFNELKGTVKNLTLNSTLNITADQLNLGILANVLSGTADGCTSQGSVYFNVDGGVTGEHHIGGLIGLAEASGATITDCTNEAPVTNDTASASGNGNELMVGGILGTFWGTEFTISGCENTGDVTNNAYWNIDISVGGIVGQAGNSDGKTCNLTVEDCTNSGSVVNNGDTDAAEYVGGIAGWVRYGTYSGNTNTGDIENAGDAPNNYVGGLIGYIAKNATLDGNSNSGSVSNSGFASYLVNKKFGGNFIGGLIGRMQTDNTFKTNSNSGTVYNSGNANDGEYIGGIVGYLDKNNVISDAPSDDETPALYKLTNSGDIENAGSAKNICIGGLFGRNSSGYFNMRGSSGVYSTNSGDIIDSSGSDKSNGGDLSIGGIAGYTTTGIKTQYARNSGNIYVTGDKGSTAINVGGIGGWISNASFNFNNCRNSGNVTIDATTTSSIWAAGIVGCPKPNTTTHYFWRSNAIIDTHAATVGGDNYTAGLMGTVEGSSANTFTMYGHRVAGTVWGSKTTTGLFCCTKTSDSTFKLQGGSDNPNRIAPGTVLKDDNREVTINDIADVTTDIIAGGEGSSYDITNAGENLVVEEW